MSTGFHGISKAQAIFCAAFVREVVECVFQNGEAADHAAAVRFKKDRRIGSRDRRFLNNTLFAYFRWYGWLLKAGIHEVSDLSLAVVSFLEGVDSEPVRFWAQGAGIPDSSVEKAMRTDSSEERFQILLDGLVSSFPAVSAWDLLPEWSVEHLPDFLREGTRLPEFLQKRPPMWLRAQTSNIPALAADLMKSGFSAEIHPKITNAMRISDARGSLYTTPEFEKGLFEIQDFSSQCIGLSCMAKPKESWWDVCAGGGGKTLQLAAMMNRQGSILATDIRGYKLEDLKRRSARAAYPNIRCREWDGKTPASGVGSFDGVLIDAPCSSSGRWRRNPDGRWTTPPARVDELCTIQRGILNAACEGVKPGGVLVYATCSLFECEDEDAVNSFLATHPDFVLEPFSDPVSGRMTDGMLRTLPWSADCDASFVARMRRLILTKG